MAAKWLKPRDVAETLGVSQRTVTRGCVNGSIPAVKIGRQWRVKPEYLEGEKECKTKKPA